MSFTYESAARLFNEGDFLRLIELSGGNEQARIALEPRHRVIIANALALVGEFDEAQRLAELDCGSPTAPAIRSQAEWTLGLVRWRAGDISSAMQHARAALRFAQESADAERLAWALLHFFRLSIDCGPMDAIMAALPDVRLAVARAGNPRASAYLHNCVAVLEGQTGRVDEARRHLDIAESLLQLAPDRWLATLVQLHQGIIACLKCEFEVAFRHVYAAKRNETHEGGQNAFAVATTLGHLEFLVGEFEKSKLTLATLPSNPAASIGMKLSALDTLARVHMAAGELEQCEEALESIRDHINSHPEIASNFNARRAAIVRAQMLLRRGQRDAALKCLHDSEIMARQFHDTPLNAAVQLQMAQVLANGALYKAAAARLMNADGLGITTIREFQASYYYATALILRKFGAPLEWQLRARALRVWDDQGIVSLRLEMDDVPADVIDKRPVRHCVNTVECVTDSLAAFVDLAYQPRLLGEEMLSAIDGLACSPAAKVIETQPDAESPWAEEDTVTLPLGTDRGKANLTLVCNVPDDPVKAVLLADVLRIGRAAIALERAREEERSRAALWPAPPIEEQAGALFLAEEMQTILATARRVAPTTAPVLITGEMRPQ
jgi:tetratricopeptide (TPR) repeat protein